MTSPVLREQSVGATEARSRLLESSWVLVDTYVLRMAGFGIEDVLNLSVPPGLLASESSPHLLEDAIASSSRWLRIVAASERFREAVLLSNPECHQRVVSYLARYDLGSPRTSHFRRSERLVARYVQRFSTKNETTSFFGPVRFGKFSGEPIRYEQIATTPFSDRCVRLSHWAAEAVVTSVMGRPTALAAREGNPLLGRIFPLSNHRVDELLALLECFRVSDYKGRISLINDLEEHFSAITGSSPRRNAGQSYGDRMLLSEDRLCPVPAENVGSAVRQTIEDFCVDPIDAFTLPDRLRFASERQSMRELVASRWGSHTPVPYQTVVAYLESHPHIVAELKQRAWQLWASESEPIFRVLREIALRVPGSNRVELAPSDLVAIRSAADIPNEWPCVLTMDLMIRAASEEHIKAHNCSLVLGELHNGLAINGFYATVHPDKATFRRELTDALNKAAHGREPLRVIGPTFNKTFLSLDLPLRSIRLNGIPHPDDQLVDLADAVIVASNDTLELCDRRTAKPFFIASKLPSIIGSFPLRLFSMPSCSLATPLKFMFRGHSHIPRLSFGPLTVVRETWRVERSQLLSSCEGLEAQMLRGYSHLAKRLGLPRFLYVRPEAHEKPVFVDQYNHFSLHDLRRRLARDTKDIVEMTEMLPTVDELWLGDEHGRHTSELRATLFTFSEDELR